MARPLILIGILFFLCCAQASAADVRVAILQNKPEFTLGVLGPYEIRGESQDILQQDVRLKLSKVHVDDGGIRIGSIVLPFQRALSLVAKKDATIEVNGRLFRGSIRIIAQDQGLLVVNDLDLEQYVRGVLYHEISDRWPLEAIKAQAVATRTYAVYSMSQYAAREFDLTNDVYSQVYGGIDAERYRTNIAVSRTQGEVLTWRGKIFPTFFHSNSGGVTESAKELWGIDIPPLAGNIVSPFSRESPHFSWKKNMRLKDIQDALNSKGFKIGAIKEIRITETTISDRVRKMILTDREGGTLAISGKDFREAMGPNSLKSNMYKVVMQGWFVDFVGHGWGHGVGLCQWGAYNMARKRYAYRKILQFYYPGSELKNLKDLK